MARLRSLALSSGTIKGSDGFIFTTRFFLVGILLLLYSVKKDAVSSSFEFNRLITLGPFIDWFVRERADFYGDGALESSLALTFFNSFSSRILLTLGLGAVSIIWKLCLRLYISGSPCLSRLFSLSMLNFNRFMLCCSLTSLTTPPLGLDKSKLILMWFSWRMTWKSSSF